MLIQTRACAWQAILLMICLTVSASATSRCSSPGWELRTTVRGLGGEPPREYSTRGTNGWQWVRDYVYGAGRVLAAIEPNEQGGENVYHIHPDHLGTPRQITNASGVQVALHSYYPFGQEATDPAQTSFTKKFTGHERDPNGTGTAGDLDYMHARYCSPTLGRFLSFDPIGGNPRAPQSWNRYAYALNSPINYTDPEGLFAALFFDLYFVVFDEITVTASSYSSLVGYFYRLAYYFSEGVRPSIYGELGRPTPPAAGVSRALLEGDELERVRFGMSYGAVDTGGVPEFLIFLPMGRISGAFGRVISRARVGRLPSMSSRFGPGPFAGESIAAQSAGRAFSSAERAEINRIGSATGCHTCGTRSPGTRSGNFVPDHQPPMALKSAGQPQRLFPQCIDCSREQGLSIARELRQREP